MVEKFMFLQHVMATLENHPEWQEEVIKAMNKGIVNRLDREINQRANCETALVMAYEAGKDNIPDKHKEKVINAIKNSFSYGGTKFAEGL